MRKLDRTIAPPPACLAAYRHPANTWKNVEYGDRRQIRAALERMQGKRCAYCEGLVDADNGHVEHFRRKGPGHYPELTFDWPNLFLSCNSTDHCGHYKDRPGAPAYNPDEIVKPDIEDPDVELYFHSTGDVRPRSGGDAPHSRRAEETIRVLNLNCGRLRARRRRAVRIYEQKEPGILEELMELDEPSRREFIDAEIESTRNDPYGTIIRHYFEKIGR